MVSIVLIIQTTLYFTKTFLSLLANLLPYGRLFSSSCGVLHPSASTMGPFRPNNEALQAKSKFLKIYLENIVEIYLKLVAEFRLEKFSEICLENFAEIRLVNFVEICLENFAETRLIFLWKCV